MTLSEILDNLPHSGVFLAFLFILNGMFLAGVGLHRIPAVLLGVSLFIFGVILNPLTPSTVQITPMITFGLVLSVLLGMLCSKLKNSSSHSPGIYALAWLFSSMLFFLALDLAANWRSNRFFYVAVNLQGIILCSLAGIGFCFVLKLACGDFKRKIIFLLLSLFIGISMLGIIAIECDNFCQVILTRYTQRQAITTLQSIVNRQEEFRKRCVVDNDKDGVGEYGYLSELSGDFGKPIGLRFYSFHKTKVPGVYEKDLYLYTIYLIAQNGYGKFPEKGKNTSSRKAWFACFAWPTLPTAGMAKTFIITKEGKIFYCDDKYRGIESIPGPERLFAQRNEGEIVFLPLDTDPTINWRNED